MPSPGDVSRRHLSGVMLLYYITDRRTCPGGIETRMTEALQAGADMVQIREKDLATRELHALAVRAIQANPGRTILINSRVDVALAAGAAGAHLPASAPASASFRRIAPPPFQFGVSCHSADEVRQAEQDGADFAVFGPVFDTPSKRAYGPPQGLEKLAEACRTVRIPVLALGGVSLANARACLDAGAAGVAGISLFQRRAPVHEVVEALRAC